MVATVSGGGGGGSVVDLPSSAAELNPVTRLLCKQDTQISYIDSKKNSLCSQDSVVSFMDPPVVVSRRHQLVKQDSVVSFVEQRPGM